METSAAGSTAAASRTTSWLFTLVPLAALVVITVVFAVSRGWYETFLFLHVAAAVVWIGGGTAFTILGVAAERARDGARLAAVAGLVEWIAMRVFTPAAIVVLAFGFALAENAGWDYGEFWLSFGLVVWLVSALTGMLFLGPQTKRLKQVIAERGVESDEAQRRILTILRVARLDVALLLLIVADMTIKPFL
jgi:uncharacterized membrane protein